MNKGELINKVAEDANISKSQASEAVNAVITAVGDSLKDGKKVSLIGFGTFAPAIRKARMGRNPKTGVSISIPEKTVVKFKPGKELQESLN